MLPYKQECKIESFIVYTRYIINNMQYNIKKKSFILMRAELVDAKIRSYIENGLSIKGIL